MHHILRTGALSLSLAAAASADVAYDNLSDQPLDGALIYGQHEVAQDVQLDPGAGMEIVGVSMRLWNPTQNVHDSGIITISLYADAGDRPGNLLASYEQTYQIPPDTVAVYFTSFEPFLSPTRDLWAAWHIEHDGLHGVGIGFGGEPFIGTTTNRYAARQDGIGEWIDKGEWFGNPFHIRITSVPEPASGLALLLLAVRRRR